MSRIFLKMILVFVLVVSVVGCNVHFVNKPTDDAIVEGLEIIGDFKTEQGPPPFEKGVVSIKRSGENQFPYLLECEFEKAPKDKMLGQTYRFGDTIVAFIKDSRSGGYFAVKLEIVEHQIEAKAIDPSFFNEHPSELSIKRKSEHRTVIDADSAALDLFFEKHHDSKSLFDQKTFWKLIRTKKDSD